MKQLNRNTEALKLNYPVKVLQFGEGNFLRGFVDWIIDILNEKSNFNAAVQVVQPIEIGMGGMINHQDGLYHVILQGIQEGKICEEKRLIKCLKGVLNPYDDYAEYLKLAENQNLKFIISNTTEAGIAFNEEDKDYKLLPHSFPGKLTALLFHRFDFFKNSSESGLTIIPCELIDKNGEALKTAVKKYCENWNLPLEFINWIDDQVTFCNSLVDRIVPGFPKDKIKDIQADLDYEDNLVVMAEPFHLWVIEAPEAVKELFPADKAGLQVKFVKDLSPYRTRKVRILNGAHTAMVPVGYLNGLRTVKEAVEHESTGKFLKEAIFEEIIPTLSLPEEELEQFAKSVMERFQNPFIRHELISIALNSISKFKVRVLPSLLEYVEKNNALPKRLTYALAALIVFYKGSWNGEGIPLNDAPQILEFFKTAWKNPSEGLAKKVLSNVDFWGQDLSLINGLLEATEENISEILSMEKVRTGGL